MTADITNATAPVSSAQPAGERHELDAKLEALLMIADEPISIVSLATAIDQPLHDVTDSLQRIRADLDGGETPRGFELREVGGGWRFYVRETYDALVKDFVHTQTQSRLSQAALETLAVVAYRQPISRGAIASIRAVNVDSVVRTLVSRGLITEVDTDPETGAVLYGTTDTLLVNLGINSLDELPPIAPLLDDGVEGFDGEQL